jgi:hypothetical protein
MSRPLINIVLGRYTLVKTHLKMEHPKENDRGANSLDDGGQRDPERLCADDPAQARLVVGVAVPAGGAQLVPSKSTLSLDE